jgi:hypothetical protein
MRPRVSVGQGMELRDRVHPIIVRADSTDRPPTARINAVALVDCATDSRQARQ